MLTRKKWNENFFGILSTLSFFLSQIKNQTVSEKYYYNDISISIITSIVCKQSSRYEILGR